MLDLAASTAQRQLVAKADLSEAFLYPGMRAPQFNSVRFVIRGIAFQ